MHRLKFFRAKTEIPAKSGRKRGPRRNRVCSGSIGKNVTEHRGDRSVSRSDCKPRKKIGESRPKSWMDVIPVRVGQASSRGQCLTSSVKLRDLDDRWGRNGGGINREDFDSSHFTADRPDDGSRNQFLNSAFFLSEESEFSRFVYEA